MKGFIKRFGLGCALAGALCGPAGAVVLDTIGETAVFNFSGLNLGAATTYTFTYTFSPATPPELSIVRVLSYDDADAQGASLVEYDLLPLGSNSSVGSGFRPLEGPSVPTGFFTDGTFSIEMQLRIGGPISIESLSVSLCDSAFCETGQQTVVYGVLSSPTVNPVPAPGSIALLAVGGLGLSGAAVRRRQRG